MSRRGDPLSDLPVGEDGEVDLSKLTERQQIALLLKQSEEEARKPTPTPKSRKPPSTPRSSRAKEPEPHSSRGHGNGSGSKKEAHVNAAYDEFASEHQSSKDGLWTPREHDRFMQIVDQHPGEIKWSTVVQQIEGRTEQQCSEYMQRLLDRGLIKQQVPTLAAPPANQSGVVAAVPADRAHQSRTPISETKRQREYANSSLQASASQPKASYKRVRSDHIPELLTKVPAAEISDRAKALLAKIEATEAKYEEAQKCSEIPELSKAPAMDPAVELEPKAEMESELDPELLNQQQHERDMLQKQFEVEVERTAVWFRESCAREAFEGDDVQAPWDVVVGFIRKNQCLAPPEAAPTAQPPKKRLSKLTRQFEQVKAALTKQQTERARALALVQSWRVQGCAATRANAEAIRLAIDPAQLSMAQHIQGQTIGDFPFVKVNFPYMSK